MHTSRREFSSALLASTCLFPGCLTNRDRELTLILLNFDDVGHLVEYSFFDVNNGDLIHQGRESLPPRTQEGNIPSRRKQDLLQSERYRVVSTIDGSQSSAYQFFPACVDDGDNKDELYIEIHPSEVGSAFPRYQPENCEG